MEDQLKKLADKVAVITGGNSGIGFATARLFVEEGAHVVIVGRRADAVDGAVALLGEKAVGLVGDVADLSTHDRVAALVAERFGHADVYFANAGMNIITPSADVTVENYDAHFLTNTRSVFFGVQKILPLVRDGGSILVTSSIAVEKVLEGHAAYAGSKAAIEAFVQSWALELRHRRIRVNVISPGPVDTPILGKLGIPSDHLPNLEVALSETIPAGRLGKAEELAQAALFLAGPDGSFVNGVTLRVDGGITLT
jgi:NAD(P)-dependent dehydrogenase (short-subunit alcohol dehydrogenase family)